MRRPKTVATKTGAPVTTVDLLRADARALQRLAASDRDTWRQLIGTASKSEACPADLTRALLALDNFDGWLGRLFRAYSGLNPDDGMGADHEFKRWFAAGIARAFPATDHRALDMRYRDALKDETADAAQHARDLVDAVERAGGEMDLFGRAYLLLARRLSEDLDQDAAIAASRSAEEVFTKLGNETWRAQAVRMRGAALLRARRIDEALVVLDTVGDSPSTSFASSGTYRYGGVIRGSDGHYHPERELAPIDDVLYRAGAIAAWAPSKHPEWVRALGTIAAATGHRGCALRAAAGTGDDVPDEDWELPRQMR